VGSLLFKKDKFSITKAHVDKKFTKFLFMMYQFEK